MENPADREITFLSRGDDIEMIQEAIKLVPHNNPSLYGYLCYLKNSMLEYFEEIEFPKEVYSIGHRKGYTEQEILEDIEKK